MILMWIVPCIVQQAWLLQPQMALRQNPTITPRTMAPTRQQQMAMHQGGAWDATRTLQLRLLLTQAILGQQSSPTGYPGELGWAPGTCGAMMCCMSAVAVWHVALYARSGMALVVPPSQASSSLGLALVFPPSQASSSLGWALVFPPSQAHLQSSFHPLTPPLPSQAFLSSQASSSLGLPWFFLRGDMGATKCDFY